MADVGGGAGLTGGVGDEGAGHREVHGEEVAGRLAGDRDAGGVEVELFLREYCLSPYLQHLGTTLFDTHKAAWGRTVQVGRGSTTTQ
mgnify:CR=1 FL=1